MKTLCVSSFISWRIAEKKPLAESFVTFQSLNQVRNSLNSVESLADFCAEASGELLNYAALMVYQMRKNYESHERLTVSREEGRRLKETAKMRKRHRLNVFNCPAGMKLRLLVERYEQKQQEGGKWCAISGCASTAKNAFRGHRSNFQCSHCHVHLCVRTYSGTRRSCWDIWHSTKRIKYRKPAGVASLMSWIRMVLKVHAPGQQE